VVNAPRALERYAMHDAIASGGMATVHLGRLVGAGGFSRPVAIKRMHAQFARDPDFVDMFLDEARLAARIAHPNVVSIIDAVVSEGEVFLVMEYVHGASLARLLRTALRPRGKPLRPPIARGVVAGLLHGLHAAHEAEDDRGRPMNLVHRDVSPQNVLVGVDGVSRLVDFGIATAAGRVQTTREGQLKGKLAYMAPEQARGEPVTRRADIYAASVVLWEALTGRRLFAAESEATVLARVLTADVPPPGSIVPGLPRGIDDIVMRGLERDPAKRHATAREMALELALAGQLASPAEIGEWVAHTAPAELRALATLLGRMERFRASRTSNELPCFSAQQLGPAESGTLLRRREPQTLPSEQDTKREGRTSMPCDLASDSTGRARGEDSRHREWRRRRIAALFAAVALATAATTIAVERRPTVAQPRSVGQLPALESARAVRGAHAEVNRGAQSAR
jgi:serine/threonine-protein kinase